MLHKSLISELRKYFNATFGVKRFPFIAIKISNLVRNRLQYPKTI